jgi:cytochrome P450 family 710 subfamily A protein
VHAFFLSSLRYFVRPCSLVSDRVLSCQRALGVYLSLQEKSVKEHFNKWFLESKEATQGLTMQDRCWMLNAHTSLTVFVGPYLNDALRDNLVADYRKVTEGFLAFPINLPGTLLNIGIKGRKSLITQLCDIVARAKLRIGSGAEPECLLDFWMQHTLKEVEEAKNKNTAAPEHTQDEDMAKVIFDFLFAAQDASTASLCWTLHLVSTHPEVLAKLREEQHTVRPNNEPLTTEMLAALPQTWQTMKEILRLRPPATMVPHKTVKPFKISEDYTVCVLRVFVVFVLICVQAPKGSLVIPFIFGATHQGFENPNVFDPTRFNNERQEHIKFDKNSLTFGCGPHMCMGYRYAMNHIMTFLSVLARNVDFKRMQTPDMNEIKYYSTIYPADGVVLEHFQALTAEQSASFTGSAPLAISGKEPEMNKSGPQSPLQNHPSSMAA